MPSTEQNAAVMEPPKGRSSTGCWTCRVRRKKCDEQSGRCATCSSLRLRCDGYGPKPVWMDGGIREKQKVEELKARLRRCRTRSQISWKRPPVSRDHQRRQSVGPVRPGHNGSSPAPADTEGSTISVSRVNRQGTIDIASMSPLGLPSAEGHELRSELGDLFQGYPLGPIAIMDQGFGSHIDAGSSSQEVGTVNGDNWLEPIFLNVNSQVPGSDDLLIGESFAMPEQDREQSVFDFGGNPELVPQQPKRTIQHGCPDTPMQPVSVPPTPWDDFTSLANSHTERTSGNDGLDSESGFHPDREVPLPSVAKRHNDVAKDSVSLYFFLNSVVPNQFPYAEDVVVSRLRSRVLLPQASGRSLLHSTINAYVKCLHARGLERYGLHTATSDKLKPTGHDIEMVRNILAATPELNQTVVQTQCLEEILVVYSQQLFFQLEDFSPAKYSLGDIAELVINNRALYKADSLLMPLFHGLLVILDIISSASLGKSLYLWALPHSVALANPSLAQMTGCQSWVFRSILDVTNLRTWKLSVVASSSLNVVELANRASAIKRGIEQQRSEILSSGGASAHAQNVAQITEVYAHAVEIYLHTTTSGAFPDVSDISDAVSKTVSAIQRLSHPQLLRSLAWPICLAASMAGREHDLLFASIENGARGDLDYSFKVIRALTVAKECQRLRKTSTPTTGFRDRRPYDWFDAMSSLGKEWNLL